jgi:hypothetical protein
MNPKKYLVTSEQVVLASQADQIGAAKAVLDAVRIYRDELREMNESSPKESPEDLKEDYRYIAGSIAALNWVLRLPQRSMEFRNKLEKGKGK